MASKSHSAVRDEGGGDAGAGGLGGLSRREQEIMHLLYEEGEATARAVWEKIVPQPTYSTVRKLLSILERKGRLTHREEAGAFVYEPVVSREEVAHSAMRRLVGTFFQGSVAQAVSGLLSLQDARLSREDYRRLRRLLRDNEPGSPPKP